MRKCRCCSFIFAQSLLRVALPHPIDEFLRGRHSGQAALANQGPVVEHAALFDLPQRSGGDSLEEFEFHNRKLGISGSGPGSETTLANPTMAASPRL